MKILVPMIIASLAIVSSVSAATGSTSTGSTSTGSVSTGSTSTGSTSTGSVSTPSISVPVSVKGGGGPLRLFNVTTNQYEMVDQCFPWVWLTEYYVGNFFDMYNNQKICRDKRLADFGI